MRFSPSTLGWYPEHTEYKNLPPDVVDVDDGIYLSLRDKRIEAGPDGQPRELVQEIGLEGRIRLLQSAVDAHMNEAARTRRYDSIHTAALRAGFPGPFHDEGMAYATWMDAVNAKCYAVLAQFLAGEIAEPTKEQLLALLPPLNLPEDKGA